jgi:hypothetical protein
MVVLALTTRVAGPSSPVTHWELTLRVPISRSSLVVVEIGCTFKISGPGKFDLFQRFSLTDMSSGVKATAGFAVS